MSQTGALFLDAYRELNSRKLFWITMVISAIVVLAFAFVGINENGLRIIAWDIAIPGFNSNIVPPATFYKMMFLNLGVGFWLGWIATVLALISTAGIFPDFISAGSIDLVLAKPIGRLRLFITKYVGGLLFVALQVSVFCTASFLVLGFRGGTWLPAVFLAIPIVTIFFSYLFCVCVLLGIITRSTIASLLLTLLAWFLMFAIGTTENAILGAKLMYQQQIESKEQYVRRFEKNLEVIRQGQSGEASPSTMPVVDENLQNAKDDLEQTKSTASKINLVHRISMGVKTCLPKTSETINLLTRWLIEMAELQQIAEKAPEQPRRGRDRDANVDMEELQLDAERAIRDRSIWWVMGTSLVFEAVVVGLAAWIFIRRDF
jgi:ABC-type transport system involved in multi-copper enzyme maturation permease subunit